MRYYIIIYSFINSSSKNSTIEVEFYQKKNYKPAFLFTEVSKGQKRNAYVRDSRLMKKICEKKSKKFLLTKAIDCMKKKIGTKKCRYSK